MLWLIQGIEERSLALVVLKGSGDFVIHTRQQPLAIPLGLPTEGITVLVIYSHTSNCQMRSIIRQIDIDHLPRSVHQSNKLRGSSSASAAISSLGQSLVVGSVTSPRA